MHDFGTANAEEMYYDEIASRVRIHKQEKQGVKTMCRIIEEYGDERVAEAKTKFVEELLRQNKLTDEEISSVSKVPLEEVKQIAERLAVTV